MSSTAPDPPSRGKLLDAGVELLLENGVDTAVGVRLADAAERAGLTTGAAYKVWPKGTAGGQDQFRRDVARRALLALLEDQPDTLTAASEALMESGTSLAELVRVVARMTIARLTADPSEVSVLFTLYGAAFVDTELQAVAAESYEDLTTTYAGLYERILRHYGRRIRAPYTATDLAGALTAVTDGFTIRLMLAPGDLDREVADARDDGPETPWSVFAVAVLGVFQILTTDAT